VAVPHSCSFAPSHDLGDVPGVHSYVARFGEVVRTECLALAEEDLVEECLREELDPCPGIPLVGHAGFRPVALLVSMVVLQAAAGLAVMRGLAEAAGLHISGFAGLLPHSEHSAPGGW
jgi:hypothetical protein